MNVLTFNIWNYQRSWRRRRDAIAALIREHRPDVAVLQETRHDFRFERGRGQGTQIADLTGYHPTWALGQVYVPLPRIDEGLTILTPDPPIRTMQRLLTRFPHEREDGNQRVCLGVVISIHGREIQVYDTHFSLSERARVSNAIEVHRFIQQHAGETPAVLMGDLNAEPDSRPIRFLTGEETIDGETGTFLDCWTSVHPNDPGYTYASFDPVRRIDYVLARGFPALPSSAQIIGTIPADGTYASDHAGILVEIPL